jgi:UDP-N-acetylmuramate dehydrogenase
MISVRLGEPIARHTAVRTGGRCDAFVVAHDTAAVAEIVADCRAVGWRLQVLGAGTRGVFRDGPVPGVVVRLGTGFAGWDLDTGEVGAAAPLPALVRASAAAGRTGLEAFVCVPGSVGASVLHDEGWADLVAGVHVLRRGASAEIGLDEARRKKVIVLGVRLALGTDDAAAVVARTRASWAKQEPLPVGSFYAAARKVKVREALQGSRLTLVRLRQIAIPDTAPELLVNLGEGSAADLALLHRSAIERVARMQGEQLVSRIKWLGTGEEEPCETAAEGSASFSVG